MSFFALLLHLHLIVVLAFLLFFGLKAALLFLGRHEVLRRLRARTRIADSLLGLLIVVSGGALLALYPAPTPGWLWLKLGLVLGLLPLAIGAMRRQHQPGVALTLLGFGYVYGLSETDSLTLRRPTAPDKAAPTVGLPEITATPDAAVPVDTTAALAGLAAAEAATSAAASPPTAPPAPDALAAGKALFTQNCAVCHGPDGKRGLNGAHDLTKSNLTTTGRVYMVTQGLGKMPAFKGQLTEAQIQQVVAYSLTLR